jgi:hypothetical protein
MDTDTDFDICGEDGIPHCHDCETCYEHFLMFEGHDLDALLNTLHKHGVLGDWLEKHGNTYAIGNPWAHYMHRHLSCAKEVVMGTWDFPQLPWGYLS